MSKLHITTIAEVDKHATYPDEQDAVVSLGFLRELIRNGNLLAPHATEDEVDQARHRHCVGSDDEIEIDEPASVSRGEDGPWVQAWVFVPKECIDGYQPD